MNPEAMTGQAILHRKEKLIRLEVLISQAILRHKGVMILQEAARGQVIRHHLPAVVHLPEVVVHLPEVAVVAGLQEVVVVPAINPLLREEGGNNMSNDTSMKIRLQNGPHHSAAFKTIYL
jgi:hypothetical protein